MKYLTKALLVLALLNPSVAAAADCSSSGFTVVLVNGVLNDLQKAQASRLALQDVLGYSIRGESVSVRLGYNESHLAGAGDLIQSVSQAFSKPVSDYDLQTILMQIHPEVTTQKILLVGHSQGSYYTNELYEYLVTHGVAKESIAVYNIATPASFVAGGGKYITSTNDKVINRVRDAGVTTNKEVNLNSYYTVGGVVASALRANETIPKEAGWDADGWGGHKFALYLDGATARIVREIDTELGKLKANEGTVSADGCFEPPVASIGYKAKSALYAVADPFVTDAARDISTVANTASTLASAAYRGLAGLFGGTGIASGGASQGAAVSLAFTEAAEDDGEGSDTPPSPDPGPIREVRVSPQPVQSPSEEAVLVPAQQIPETPAPQSLQAAPIPPQQLFPVTPGYGGGGGGSAAVQPVADEDPEPDSDADPEPQPDVTPTDAPIARVPACEHSLASSFCFVASRDVSVYWEDVTDAASYAVALDGVVGPKQSATTSAVSLATGDTTTIAVIAYDEAGNAATSTPVDVFASTQSLLINEVAWGGDNTSAANQWIEIKNLSPYTINLSQVSIMRTGGAPIPLSGTIDAHGLLVIEPTNIPYTGEHKLIVPFGALSTSGEQLSLVMSDDASTVLDTTPASGTCTGWCAGAAFDAKFGDSASGSYTYMPRSMERISSTSDGTLASSWQTTDSYGAWVGTGQPEWGTPGAENSEGLPEAGVNCGASGPVVADSPYNPGSDGCTYLMRFISPNSYHYAGLYRGEVASSTALSSHFFGKSLANFGPTSVPSDTLEGEKFFFAMWEQRIGDAFEYDTTVFSFYLTQGASSTQGVYGPPHGNYVTIPWTYRP